MKNKKSNSRQHFNHIKQLLKCKRSQGIFGMSFQMIFSILLIVFFIAVAFIAINFFLGIQRQSQIGFFLTDLQDEIDVSWQSQEGEFYFNGTLPGAVESVCFLNMSSEVFNSDPKEQEIFNSVRFSGMSLNINFVLWPPEAAEDLAFKKLEHLQLPESNPYCIEVKNGMVSIKINKEFSEALPRVS